MDPLTSKSNKNIQIRSQDNWISAPEQTDFISAQRLSTQQPLYQTEVFFSQENVFSESRAFTITSIIFVSVIIVFLEWAEFLLLKNRCINMDPKNRK